MLIYAIKSMITLSVMYIPYMLLLRNESFFRFNRVILISIMLLSLVLPLFDVHMLSVGENPVVQNLHAYIEIGEPIMVVGAPEIADAGTSVPEVGNEIQVNWIYILSLVYIAGLTVTLVVKLIQILLLVRSIRKGVLWVERINGVKVYCHVGDVAPFSFFRTIVINEKDYYESATEIIGHEMGHITNYHSFDILLVNICEAVQWCNPLSWILAGSLRDTHEYEADDAVLASGIEAHKYQMLLIKKAVGSSSYAFANSFNHSLLKKRIAMMIREKSNPWMRTKSLYIIPVAAIALSAFATPELNTQIDKLVGQNDEQHVQSSVITDKDNQIVVKEEALSAENVENVAELPVTEEIVAEKSLNDYLIIIEGKVSSVSDLKALEKTDKTIAYGCNLEPVRKELKALGIQKIVVFQNEENIRKMYSKAGDSKAENGIVIVNPSMEEDGLVFLECEQMPEYPGGLTALMQFIGQNVKYPKLAFENAITGKIQVSFVVNKDGSIRDIHAKTFDDIDINASFPEVIVQGYMKEPGAAQERAEIIKAATQSLIDEAERVVSLTKGWTPGFQRGRVVDTRYIIPIRFRLQ